MKNLKTKVFALLASLVLGAMFVASPPAVALTQYAYGDASHILGNYVLFPYGFRTAAEYQSAPCSVACRAALVAGVYTWTFTAGEYSASPVCIATEESVTGHYLKITAISASSVTFTSDVTSSNVDFADMRCTAAGAN